ncbi:MAG: NifU family protein [Pseudomonadota bacterium]
MFIEVEETPNPATLKFIPGQPLAASHHFDSPQSAADSPLASRLFEVGGISSVYLGSDFISVSKTPQESWTELKPVILAGIMDHFASGEPAIRQSGPPEQSNAVSAEDDDVVQQIKELLHTRVSPAVARDGGDIQFHSFDEGVVHLVMRGACAGCPSSTFTLKAGIENLLRHYIPQVKEVRAVEEAGYGA